MEIYAICNGRIAHFNEDIKKVPGNEDNDYFTLQIIFDPTIDDFESDDFSKFILYQASKDAIQTMIPEKIINVKRMDPITHTVIEVIPYLLFKVILKNRGNGQLVKMNPPVDVGGHSTFAETFAFQPTKLIDDDFTDFMNTQGLDIKSFVCSVTRAPCP